MSKVVMYNEKTGGLTGTTAEPGSTRFEKLTAEGYKPIGEVYMNTVKPFADRYYIRDEKSRQKGYYCGHKGMGNNFAMYQSDKKKDVGEGRNEVEAKMLIEKIKKDANGPTNEFQFTLHCTTDVTLY